MARTVHPPSAARARCLGAALADGGRCRWGGCPGTGGPCGGADQSGSRGGDPAKVASEVGLAPRPRGGRPFWVGTHLHYCMRMSAYSNAPEPPSGELVDLAVEVFAMLADATRVQLLWNLRGGELSVGELADRLMKPQALISQHLAKLRMAHLVQTRRQGNRVFYRLANEHVHQLLVDGLFHAEHVGPGVPDHHRPADAAHISGAEHAPVRRA